ncbi:MAG TPA: hypothetical protein VGE16_12850 [Albitalea sp.]
MKILVQRSERHRRWAGVLLFAVITAPLLWWEHHEASARNASLELEPASFEGVAKLPLAEPQVFDRELPPPASLGDQCPEDSVAPGASHGAVADAQADVQPRSPC